MYFQILQWLNVFCTAMNSL